MKKLFSLSYLGAFICAFTFLSANGVLADQGSAANRILIAYFSMSGHTKTIAADIQALTGGELVEIVPEKEYPGEYQKLTEVAKKEQNSNARPAIRTRLANPGQYDVVFLGYPNWWSSMPMPVYSFIEQNGLNGKTIIPFSTHGGGGLGHSIEDLKKLCPDSRILKPFSISGNRAIEAMPALKNWLKGLNLKNGAKNAAAK